MVINGRRRTCSGFSVGLSLTWAVDCVSVPNHARRYRWARSRQWPVRGRLILGQYWGPAKRKWSSQSGREWITKREKWIGYTDSFSSPFPSIPQHTFSSAFTVQELCESRGGHPRLSVLRSLTVSVDVKQHWTMLRHWSQFVPDMSADLRGHEALHHHHLQHSTKQLDIFSSIAFLQHSFPSACWYFILSVFFSFCLRWDFWHNLDKISPVVTRLFFLLSSFGVAVCCSIVFFSSSLLAVL